MPPMDVASHSSAGQVIGRYQLFRVIASGGMGSVYLGKLVGAVGFHRTVAIKKLHPHLATDEQFVNMLVDEARLAGRIRHPNVVPTIDVIAQGGELLIVMEYVHGESLSKLLRLIRQAGATLPLPVLSSIICGLLYGLHAAHEARDELGNPLHIVHRDVSPQNLLVGLDGVSRVVDFGVAKAVNRLQQTRGDFAKGKVPYMAPEQLRAGDIDRRVDVYAAAVVLWECLAGRRLFTADNDFAVASLVLEGNVPPPGSIAAGVPPRVDEIVMRGLAKAPSQRWESALEMSAALETAIPPATSREVSAWVASVASESLAEKGKDLADVESSPAMPFGPGIDSLPDPPTRLVRRSSPRIEDLQTEQLSVVTATDGVSIKPRSDALDSARSAVVAETGGSAVSGQRTLLAALLGAATIAVVAGVTAAVLLTRAPGDASPSAAAAGSASNSAGGPSASAPRETVAAPATSPSAPLAASAPRAPATPPPLESAEPTAQAAPPGKRPGATAATATSGPPKPPATAKKGSGRDLLDDQL